MITLYLINKILQSEIIALGVVLLDSPVSPLATVVCDDVARVRTLEPLRVVLLLDPLISEVGEELHHLGPGLRIVVGYLLTVLPNHKANDENQSVLIKREGCCSLDVSHEVSCNPFVFCTDACKPLTAFPDEKSLVLSSLILSTRIFHYTN